MHSGQDGSEVVGLRKENRRLRREVDRLNARVAQLEPLVARVAELEKLVAQLTAQPHPGRDPPAWAKPQNHKARPKTPGAREGHAPHHRESRPPDEEKQATLTHCPDCHTRLGPPIGRRKRVVEDLVPARIHVTWWWVARYWCRGCRKKVEARPSGVLAGQRFGAFLMLFVVSLRVLGVTFDKIQRHLWESYHVWLSHGAILHMEAVVARALGPAYERLKRQLRKAKAVHADDTSWRVDGVNHWLWVLLSKTVAVFTIERRHGKSVIERILGPDFAGVVITDFFPSFKRLPYAAQKCLVHLLRELRRFAAKPDFRPSREWTRVCIRVKRMVHEAAAAESWASRRRRSALRRRLVARAHAVASLPREHAYAKTVAKLVGTYADDLFRFLDHPTGEVHWENNPAERKLRPLIVGRKLSHGSRSPQGAHNRCLNQSLAETARLQDKSWYAYAATQMGVSLSGTLPGS